MRAVVDTNILVSAILKDQSLLALVVHVIEQRGVLLKSTATERIVACRDPTDDKFLELPSTAMRM